MSAPASDSDFSLWMQEEHKMLASLSKVLREHMAAPPETNRGKWLGGLSAGFARLRAHLERNFSAQEAEGYLAHVLECRPALQPQVEAIKHEHDEMRRLAEWITAEFSQIAPDDRVLVADLCARIDRYMNVVHDHEQRENMITLLVFNQDIGGD